MKNLLCENYYRLIKQMSTWVGMFLTVLTTFICAASYLESGSDPSMVIDAWCFRGILFVHIISSVVLGLFCFHDYSDGTLRQKISSGHTRNSYYLADLISLCGYTLLLSLISIATTYFISLTDITKNGFDKKAALSAVILILVLSFSNTALSLCIGMLFKTVVGAILPLIINLAMFLILIFIPPDKDIKISVFINDFLPYGQMNAISCMETPENYSFIILYSVILFLVSTIVGIMAFRRTDIK